MLTIKSTIANLVYKVDGGIVFDHKLKACKFYNRVTNKYQVIDIVEISAIIYG